jgi:hypothetical protein
MTDPRFDGPRFDTGRSAEIRDLLTATVRDTRPPRVARLSRPAFALAASAALLAAGGVGAGGAVAIDAYSASRVLVQQDSQPSFPESTEDAGAMEDTDALAGDAAAFVPEGLVPFATLQGEDGFAYSADITAAEAAAVTGDSDGASDSGSKSSEAAGDATGIRIPIFRADGTTVIGFYVPTSTP